MSVVTTPSWRINKPYLTDLDYLYQRAALGRDLAKDAVLLYAAGSKHTAGRTARQKGFGKYKKINTFVSPENNREVYWSKSIRIIKPSSHHSYVG